MRAGKNSEDTYTEGIRFHVGKGLTNLHSVKSFEIQRVCFYLANLNVRHKIRTYCPARLRIEWNHDCQFQYRCWRYPSWITSDSSKSRCSLDPIRPGPVLVEDQKVESVSRWNLLESESWAKARISYLGQEFHFLEKIFYDIKAWMIQHLLWETET